MTSPPMEHPTGLIFDHDQRNSGFMMRAALAPLTETRQGRPAEKFWTFGYQKLNQGNTGTCVGHAGEHFLLCQPITQKAPGMFPNAFDLYYLSCDLDGIAANDNHDVNFGTTTNGLMKALRQLGLIAEWRWAQSIEDVKDWLAFKGPVFAGINWYETMFIPDLRGFVNLGGRVVGGHEFIIRGYGVDDVRGVYYRCVNSWGDGWGDHGEFNLSEDDLVRLLFGESGDCAATMEVALNPTPIPPAPEPEPAPAPEPAPPTPEPDPQGPYLGTNYLGWNPTLDMWEWELELQPKPGWSTRLGPYAPTRYRGYDAARDRFLWTFGVQPQADWEK